MKAKDYYQKYHDGILSPVDEVSNRAVADLLTEMVREVAAITNARNVKTISGIRGAVEEMDQRFRAILSLFEKKDGVRPMVDDGFMKALEIVSPELLRYIEMDKELHAPKGGAT